MKRFTRNIIRRKIKDSKTKIFWNAIDSPALFWMEILQALENSIFKGSASLLKMTFIVKVADLGKQPQIFSLEFIKISGYALVWSPFSPFYVQLWNTKVQFLNNFVEELPFLKGAKNCHKNWLKHNQYFKLPFFKVSSLCGTSNLKYTCTTVNLLL